MAKKGSGGYRRTSRTAKGTGVRSTTTYNRNKGITRSTSIKNGKNARTTYTTTPKGQTKITRTYKDASGYITRTTKSLSTVTKLPKPKKIKAYKPPKVRATTTKFYSSGGGRRKSSGGYKRRRSSGNSGCAVILLAPFAITLLTYLTSTII